MDLPEELKPELRKLGFRKVHRHQMAALQLLIYEIEPGTVIEKLMMKGFSRDLAEWMVFELREEVERQRENEHDEKEGEPSVTESVLKLILWSLLLALMMEVAAIVQRTGSMGWIVMTIPWLMVGSVIAAVSLFSSFSELWERWRARKLMK